MLNSLLSFVIVLGAAFGIYSAFDIKSQLTPLISISTMVTITILFGLYDMLKPGVLVSYGVALCLFALGLYRNKSDIKKCIAGFFTPGVILFIISCVAMLLFMYLRQPLMTEWDEFSFWGISGRLVKIHDQLYTYYKSSMIGRSTPPALPVLSYYFMWAAEYAEWVVFFAYDLVFFACYSAFSTIFDKKSWNSAVMVYLYGFLLPFVFEVYTRIIRLEPMYMYTLADVPLGIVFAGGIATYLFNDKTDSRRILCLLPVMMFLTYIKDMGFALSCIIAFIVFFDTVVAEKNFSFLKIKGLPGKIAAGFVMVATAVATFFSWSLHMARVMRRDPFALGGEANLGMFEMLIVGTKELLFGPRSDKFVTIMGLMKDAFFKTKISFLGSSATLFAIVTRIFVLAIIFNDKNGRIRSAVMWLTSLIGFTGYYIFHIFLYVYIFKDNAYGLVSYNRYIYTYHIGWLSMAVFALCLAVKNGRRFFAKTTLFCFSGILLVLFNFYTEYDYLFIGCNDRSFAVRNHITQKLEFMGDRIGEDDVLYIYSGGDTGLRWFIYTHELAANYVMEDTRVDTTGCTTEEEIRDRYRETFYQRFKAAGVTHVLIDSSEKFFNETFGDLFDVPIDYIGRDSVGYYKVNYENDFFNFTEVKGGIVE